MTTTKDEHLFEGLREKIMKKLTDNIQRYMQHFYRDALLFQKDSMI